MVLLVADIVQLLNQFVVAHAMLLFRGLRGTGTDLPAEGAAPLEGGWWRVNTDRAMP